MILILTVFLMFSIPTHSKVLVVPDWLLDQESSTLDLASSTTSPATTTSPVTTTSSTSFTISISSYFTLFPSSLTVNAVAKPVPKNRLDELSIDFKTKWFALTTYGVVGAVCGTSLFLAIALIIVIFILRERPFHQNQMQTAVDCQAIPDAVAAAVTAAHQQTHFIPPVIKSILNSYAYDQPIGSCNVQASMILISDDTGSEPEEQDDTVSKTANQTKEKNNSGVRAFSNLSKLHPQSQPDFITSSATKQSMLPIPKPRNQTCQYCGEAFVKVSGSHENSCKKKHDSLKTA